MMHRESRSREPNSACLVGENSSKLEIYGKLEFKKHGLQGRNQLKRGTAMNSSNNDKDKHIKQTTLRLLGPSNAQSGALQCATRGPLCIGRRPVGPLVLEMMGPKIKGFSRSMTLGGCGRSDRVDYFSIGAGSRRGVGEVTA